jgi:hypothetical protein
MTLKEKLKREIDRLPDKILIQLQRYLKNLNINEKVEKGIPKLHLKGQYDDLDLRRQAYE